MRTARRSSVAPVPYRLLIALSCALLSSRAVEAQPFVTASSATAALSQTPRTRLESMTPRLRLSRVVSPLVIEAPMLRAAPSMAITLPAHEPGAPSPFVSFRNNPAAAYFQMKPIDGWTWAGLGLGTASIGLGSLFLQLAGATTPNYLPRIPGVQSAEQPMLFSLGSYSLSYASLGTMGVNAGVSALSSNLLRLVFAPRNRRETRFMRTFATELQGGWLFGVEGAL